MPVGLSVKESFAKLVFELQVFEPFRATIISDQAYGSFGRRPFVDYRRGTRRISPTPRVSKPKMRKDVQGGGVWSTIKRFDADAKIFAGGLTVFDEDVEITVLFEDTGIQKFKLRAPAAALSIFGH